MSYIDIIPSILVQDEKTFIKWSRAVQEIISMIQLDIADGKFVPNKTWADPEIVHDELEIDCELHLMVADPLKEIRMWEEVQQVKRILIHYESNPRDISDIINQARSYNWEVGLVLNPDTPVYVIDNLIEEIDLLMCMGVTPGRQGQQFIQKTIDKIKEARTKFPNLYIEVDGGVNEETVPDIVRAGVNAICPGSAIFGNHKTPMENISKLCEQISMLT